LKHLGHGNNGTPCRFTIKSRKEEEMVELTVKRAGRCGKTGLSVKDIVAMIVYP